MNDIASAEIKGAAFPPAGDRLFCVARESSRPQGQIHELWPVAAICSGAPVSLSSLCCRVTGRHAITPRGRQFDALLHEETSRNYGNFQHPGEDPVGEKSQRQPGRRLLYQTVETYRTL
ncbi:hypothetical protein AVEN_37746-1 [Araneus ventricosus]|uniref:Uncharacterized protein n=1 Tax=Araneus ventricosus TaxID=182803 RepID=A0A4Y2BVJ1_ARAVE|nr:hypothetical protein AVEN_37746-1 [Araneus ventricosus]